MWKLDFLWKRKFEVERDEVETMGSLNKVLLENILPAHVARHFMHHHRNEVNNNNQHCMGLTLGTV